MKTFLLLLALLAIVYGQLYCPNLGVRFGGLGHSTGLELPPTTPNWYTLQTFTLEAWVYPLSGNFAGTHVLGALGPDSGAGFVMVSESNFEFRLFTESLTAPFIASFTLPMGDWSHIAATFDGSNLNVYVNGQASSSTPVSGGALSYAGSPIFWVGGQGSVSSAWYGSVDEVRLWSTARSAQDIAASRAVSLLPGSAAELQLYLALNDMDSAVARDSSGKGRDAEVTGASDRAWVVTCEACPANAQQGGWCTPQPLAALRTQAGPMPDLLPDFPRLEATLELQVTNFNADSCALKEGCVGAVGTRSIMRFDTSSMNQGDADLVMGIPTESPDLYQFDDCHGHYHFQQFATFVVFDSAGVERSVGRKQAFCLMDSSPVANYIGAGNVSQVRQHTCSFQGISAGWQDTYQKTIDCQWIDVTALEPGTYSMYVEMNVRDGMNHQIKESDYVNNGHYVPLVIPDRCPEARGISFNASAVNNVNGGPFVNPLLPNSAITVTPWPASRMGDDAWLPVDLPFTFRLFCSEYRTLYMDTNGLIGFDGATINSANPEDTLDLYPGAINCLWNDWNPSIGNASLYTHVGTAPSGNPEVCFTWMNVLYFSDDPVTSDPITFQCCVEEGSNAVSYRFEDTVATGRPWSEGGAWTKVGVSGTSGDTGAYVARPLTSGTSLRVLPSAENTPPVLILEGTQMRGAVGEPIFLDASGSYDEGGLDVEIVWYFPDGREPETAPFATHVFETEGIHTIRVTAKEVGMRVKTVDTSFNVTIVAPGVCGNGVCEPESSREDSCSCPSDCPDEPCHCYPRPQYSAAAAAPLQLAGAPGDAVWSSPQDYPASAQELLVGDDGSAALQLPFAFPFFCDVYSTLYVNANGYVSFVNAEGPGTADPSQWRGVPDPLSIAAYWSDLDTSPAGGGVVYAHTAPLSTGTPSVRQTCITWMDALPFSIRSVLANSTGLTFQVCLVEGSGDIVIRYLDMDTGLLAASFGANALTGVGGADLWDYLTITYLQDNSVLSSTFVKISHSAESFMNRAPVSPSPSPLSSQGNASSAGTSSGSGSSTDTSGGTSGATNGGNTNGGNNSPSPVMATPPVTIDPVSNGSLSASAQGGNTEGEAVEGSTIPIVPIIIGVVVVVAVATVAILMSRKGKTDTRQN